MSSKFKAGVASLRNRLSSWDKGRTLYMAFALTSAMPLMSQSAFAADTIWTKASAIMQDVYTQVLAISTIAAIVTASIALLLMNFSKSGKTVDESRAWLKRIVITWPCSTLWVGSWLISRLSSAVVPTPPDDTSREQGVAT